MERKGRGICFTYCFECFLKGLVGCTGGCVAGVRFLGWLAGWGFLIFRLSWWWHLLLILFLAHLLKAVKPSLWHLHGRWRTSERGLGAPLCRHVPPFQTALAFFNTFLYLLRVMRIKLIHEKCGNPLPGCSYIQFFHPPSMAYVRGCK